MSAQPWFSEWNYRVLRWLFEVVRHGARRDTFFQFLTMNHLVSNWIFAAAFYLFWRKEDERKEFRRTQLFRIVVAFAIAVIITLLVRPWITWPAPGLSPRFQALYPNYFWGTGSYDSFPSHSTLTDFVIAAGLWQLSRPVSIGLAVCVLGVISLPRVFVGGHYPIDVVASLVLIIVVLVLIGRWQPPENWRRWLAEDQPAHLSREFVLLLWLFEVGEDFRGLSSIVFHLRKLAGV